MIFYRYKDHGLSCVADRGLNNPDVTGWRVRHHVASRLFDREAAAYVQSLGLKAVAVVLHRLINFRSPEQDSSGDFFGQNFRYFAEGSIMPIFKKIKNALSGTPPEIKNTLHALKNSKALFLTNDVYGSIAVDRAFANVKNIITSRDADTIHSISVDEWKPSDLAMLLICKTAANALSSGQYHIYRATLSGEGHGYKRIFRIAVEQLRQSGFISEDDAKQDLLNIEKSIKAAG